MEQRRLTQRGLERRRQLMAFAAERFADGGYHPTSVAEIVEGLGVGKGVFYWYFSSKEELFLEILREAQQDLRRTQQRAIDGLDDPVQRIVEGIRASIAWSAAHPDVHKLSQFAVTDERFAPAMRKGQKVAVRDAVQHVAEAVARGEVTDTDPELTAHAILGVTTQLIRVYVHGRSRPPEEVADAAVAFVLDGILARSTARAPG
jgi:AcrR family transcriptional regulator